MKEGEKSVQIGKLNRNRILKELLEWDGLAFSELKRRVPFSAKTLIGHLRILEDEKLVKREIQGRSIKYVVRRPQTILQMRKDFQKELVDLITRYGSCLNKKTHNLLGEPLKTLQESIEHPEPDAQTSKIFHLPSVKIREGPGTITFNLEEPYAKPEVKKSKPVAKRGRPKRRTP